MDNTLTIIPPQELMRQATDVAHVCKEIVEATAVTIQGKKYIPIEGWQSIAIAHGCFTWGGEPVFVEENGIYGYEADGFARLPDGSIITAKAAGFVGSDEVWGERAVYAQRAMAQTRAASRISRALFAHVVTLMKCGLSTTPAEEVPLNGFAEKEAKLDERDKKRETEARQAGGEETWEGIIADCREKKGDKNGKEWILYTVKMEDGKEASTFSDTLSGLAVEAGKQGSNVKVSVKPGRRGGTFELLGVEVLA